MDWHGRNTSLFALDTYRFRYYPKINTVIQCYHYDVRYRALILVHALIMPQSVDPVRYEVQKLPDHELRVWLRDVRGILPLGRQHLIHHQAPEHSTDRTPVRGIRIV